VSVRCSETVVAAYLAGELDRAARERFDAHLLACMSCWAEVRAGRDGRAAVELLRERAPDHLRQQVRDAVSAAAGDPAPSPAVRPGSPRVRRRVVLSAAAVVAVAGLLGGVLVANRDVDQPAPIAAAVAGFREARLPGTGMPADEAPDLSALDMKPYAASAGRIGGLPASAYAYRDGRGGRLLVYANEVGMPVARGAERLTATTWLARSGDVTVLCGRAGRTLLVVALDRDLVLAAATELGLLGERPAQRPGSPSSR
jgi:anti-sigma factor RsiW